MGGGHTPGAGRRRHEGGAGRLRVRRPAPRRQSRRARRGRARGGRERRRRGGRPAHAATPWRGESVLPEFERIRRPFADLERERAGRVTHPLYDKYPVPWPVVCGTVRAGSFASTVPGTLAAEWRIGVAPGETVAEVEREFRQRLRSVAEDDEWLREHPPTFERFGVQFEPSEIDPDEPVVGAVRDAMGAHELDATDPVGATYGTDARHYREK